MSIKSSIRAASLEDLTPIGELLVACLNAGKGWVPEGDYSLNVPYRMKPNHALFVAERTESRGKTVVGFVECVREMRPHPPEISNLFVHPQYGGQGIGDQLFRHAVHYCGLGTVVSTYERNETACKFYERQGCILVGRAPTFNLQDVMAGDMANPNWRVTYVVPQERVASIVG
jgi:ribosomal protein S18 acetylase RimI-like enzyme